MQFEKSRKKVEGKNCKIFYFYDYEVSVDINSKLKKKFCSIVNNKLQINVCSNKIHILNLLILDIRN